VKRNIITGLRYLGVAALLTLMAVPLHANPILPGQTVTPDVFTPPIPLVLGETTGTFSLPVGGGSITGTYTDIVVADPNSTVCTGCLGFGLQITVDSTSPGAITTVFDSPFPFRRGPARSN
jgi:hypothetical protein